MQNFEEEKINIRSIKQLGRNGAILLAVGHVLPVIWPLGIILVLVALKRLSDGTKSTIFRNSLLAFTFFCGGLLLAATCHSVRGWERGFLASVGLLFLLIGICFSNRSFNGIALITGGSKFTFPGTIIFLGLVLFSIFAGLASTGLFSPLISKKAIFYTIIPGIVLIFIGEIMTAAAFSSLPDELPAEGKLDEFLSNIGMDFYYVQPAIDKLKEEYLTLEGTTLSFHTHFSELKEHISRNQPMALIEETLKSLAGDINRFKVSLEMVREPYVKVLEVAKKFFDYSKEFPFLLRFSAAEERRFASLLREREDDLNSLQEVFDFFMQLDNHISASLNNLDIKELPNLIQDLEDLDDSFPQFIKLLARSRLKLQEAIESGQLLLSLLQGFSMALKSNNYWQR